MFRQQDDPCEAIAGPMRDQCANGGGGGGGGGGGDLPAEADPLARFAQSVADSAAWVARKVGDVLDEGQQTVDFTNMGFLRQYAVVFAASVILVTLLWLLAVAKRAVRGVPMTEALGEAIGLLWLAVLVTAFSPLMLYVVVQATAGVSRALSKGLGADGSVYTELARVLEKGEMDGGPIILMLVSLVTIVLCGAVLMLMVLSTLALYVGALFGIPIHAGLVDKDLWGHTRRWAAVMVGLILIEPLLVVVIGMAAIAQEEGDIVTALATTVIALGLTVMVITRLPGWGDSVRVLQQTGRGARTAAGVAAAPVTAAAGVIGGMAAHDRRDHRPNTVSGPSKSTGGDVSGGMAAHSTRRNNTQRNDTKPKPRRDDTK